MKTSLFQLAVVLALLPGALEAQLAGAAGPALGVQNFDISLFCTVNRIKPLPIQGSDLTVYGHTTVGCFSDVFGYQFARASAVSLWVELAPAYIGAGKASAETAADTVVPGTVSSKFIANTIGLRLMVPIQRRVSVYGALGGGGGIFHEFQALRSPTPSFVDSTTYHGLLDFGGGIDLRLSRHFSIRGDMRDFVTAKGLSGITGRNHLLPSIGASLHF